MLLIRIEDWEQFADVCGEYFKDIKPVDIVVEVGRFFDPEWLIEIEVDAVLSEEDTEQVLQPDPGESYPRVSAETPVPQAG